MSTSPDGSLIRRANFLHSTKRVTFDEFQQEERDKKRNWKHPQGTVISVNEFWHHILKYLEFIIHFNFVMIQITLLESRTLKSLQNTDNPTNNNFTQYDVNVTNNHENVVICLNELRQSLSKNRHFSESQSAMHKDMQLYKTSCKLDG